MNVKNNYVHENIADIGGHKILGMSGSLTGYIRTGNPYDAEDKRRDADTARQDSDMHPSVPVP